MKVKLLFLWYDLWVGFYWDKKNRTLYVCPLPTVVIRIKFKAKLFPEPQEIELADYPRIECGHCNKSILRCHAMGIVEDMGYVRLCGDCFLDVRPWRRNV